jgi:hypothetical protein
MIKYLCRIKNLGGKMFSIIKDIIEILSPYIKKFCKDSKVALEIECALQEIFKEYINNGNNKYLDDICEDDLIKNVIQEYLNSSTSQIDGQN